MSKSDPSQAFDLILVGAVSKDENIYPDGRECSMGGAVTYGAFAAKRSGARVGIITRLAPADRHLCDLFADEQIPVWALPSKRTTAIRNVYHTMDKERRTCTCLAAADAFTPESLPAVTAKILHAAALIKGEIPLQTLQSLSRFGEVGLDVQGLLRVSRGAELVFEKSDEVEQALGSVTYLKADAAEAEILTATTDLAAAARELSAMGPKEVVVSHNHELVLACGKNIYRTPLTPKIINGRTGRGDTLFGSYLARRTLGDAPFDALKFAAALVSLKLEAPGPFRGTLADVRLKMQQ
ncbi:MAG: PfkB family carbohydrate kinase [Thermodesulfobacteriota bacterium]